jgi:hypothetical protein
MGMGANGYMAIGYVVIKYMAIGYGYWLVIIGYGYIWGPMATWLLAMWSLIIWLLVMGIGYWLVIIDYMDRVRLGVLRFGVRTSFMWV